MQVNKHEVFLTLAMKTGNSLDTELEKLYDRLASFYVALRNGKPNPDLWP